MAQQPLARGSLLNTCRGCMTGADACTSLLGLHCTACQRAGPHVAPRRRDLEDVQAVRQHLAGCTALLHVAGYYRWWARDPSSFERESN